MEVLEWLEGFVNIIKVWVRGLRKAEGSFSVMELLHFVKGFGDVSAQFKGFNAEFLSVVQALEFSDLGKVILVLSELLGE